MSTAQFYACWDESGCVVQIEATSAEAAAEEYADGGDWDTCLHTRSVHISVTEDTQDEYEDDAFESDLDIEVVRVEIAPDAPPCDADVHTWSSPYDIVGGCEENPGVWGQSGGVVIKEVCQTCGCGQTTDTWATDSYNGTQGHRHVKFEPGEWLERLDWAANRLAESLAFDLSQADWKQLDYLHDIGGYEVDESSGLGCIYLDDLSEWVSARAVEILLSRPEASEALAESV